MNSDDPLIGKSYAGPRADATRDEDLHIGFDRTSRIQREEVEQEGREEDQIE